MHYAWNSITGVHSSIQLHSEVDEYSTDRECKIDYKTILSNKNMAIE